MARLTGPDEGSRFVYRLNGNAMMPAVGAAAVFYTDAAGTTLADIRDTNGNAVASTLTVDTYSRLPLFQLPDGVDTVYVSVAHGPLTPVYARTDDRLDALVAGAAAEVSARAAADAAALVAANSTYVSLTGAQSIAGDKTLSGRTTFTGAVVGRAALFGNTGVGTDGLNRLSFNHSGIIDGSLLTAANPGDKVGMQNSVTFRGGFTGEAGFGVSNAGFLFGANDYIVSGTTSGDLAGATNMIGRLVEVHAQAPGTDLTVLKALQVEGHLEPAATGGHVTNFYGVHILTPRNGGTIDTATGLLIDSPTTATTNIALNVAGAAMSKFGGDLHMSLGAGSPRILHGYSGELRGKYVTVGGTDAVALGGVPLARTAMLTAKSNGDSDVVACLRGRSGQTGNILEIAHDGYSNTAARFTGAGVLVQAYPAAPGDSELVNNELALWVDGSSGAMKLMLKGRDNGGTIRTGQVALT